VALGTRLAVFDDGLPPKIHGVREACFHPLERGPATFVSETFRTNRLRTSRVDNDQVRVAPDVNQALSKTEDLRGAGSHRGDEPGQFDIPRPSSAHQEREGGRDAWDPGWRLIERDLFLVERVRGVITRDDVDPALSEGIP
jgi:hypothetical protein